MKRYRVFVSVLLLWSCDLLRPAPFEVAGWGPGEGYRDPNSGAAISVRFSREPDKGSVERSFEFSEDGVQLGGRFSWADATLTFTPSSPPRYGCDYTVAVNTDAQDTEGVSLEKRFEGRWTTRPLEGRPAIIATVPDDNGVINPGYTGVAVRFSTVVSMNAFLNHVSFSPRMKGSWVLDNEDLNAVFTPHTAWRRGTAYKMTVGAAFENTAGKTLGKDVVVHFTADGETVPPALTGITVLDENGGPVQHDGKDYALLGLPAENAGWEAGYRLLFRFSERVDARSFQKAVSVEPSLSFAVDTVDTVDATDTADVTDTAGTTNAKQGFSDEIVLSFTERPVFGERYLISVGAGFKDEAGNESVTSASYRIYANGQKSKPPELKKLAIQSGGTSRAFGAGDHFNTLSIPDDENAVMTLWFDTARGADINLYSLMECFDFSSTNDSMTFEASSIAYGTAAEGESRPALIAGSLIGKNTERGVITIAVGAGLLDTYGNRQPKAQRIVLLK